MCAVLSDLKDTSDSSPAYSRDGKRIAFARAHRLRRYSMGGFIWDDYDIYVTNADGSDPRRLTAMKFSNANSPHFTADGGSVIFAGNTNNYPASSSPLLLEVVADGTSRPHILGPEPEADGAGQRGGPGAGAWADGPHISLDGKTIAFMSDRTRSFFYDIHVMKRDGSAEGSLGMTPSASTINRLFSCLTVRRSCSSRAQNGTRSRDRSSASGKSKWMERMPIASPTAGCLPIRHAGSRSRDRAGAIRRLLATFAVAD